jgi:hypothetical protein
VQKLQSEEGTKGSILSSLRLLGLRKQIDEKVDKCCTLKYIRALLTQNKKAETSGTVPVRFSDTVFLKDE